MNKDFDSRIILKKVNKADSEEIWHWRNDPITRQMSLNKDEVGWEDHSRWFQQALSDPQHHLFIGYLESGGKVGICRFNVSPNQNHAEVSINLNPEYRNKKLSTVLLKSAVDHFLRKNNINLLATIAKENSASIRCFTRCEFKLSHEKEGLHFYERKKKLLDDQDIQN